MIWRAIACVVTVFTLAGGTLSLPCPSATPHFDICLPGDDTMLDRPGTPLRGVPSLIFATYVDDATDLHWALVLAESIRQFAGAYREAPVWICLRADDSQLRELAVGRTEELGLTIFSGDTPSEARRFPYSGKVYAAARAESRADGKADILAWIDPDAVVTTEPRAFALPKGIALGYRPVMHKLIGSSYDRPLDDFWSRVYELLHVSDSLVYPLTTPVGRETIRAYFNAGLLIVRPGRGLLRQWPENFRILYEDSVCLAMCTRDHLKNVFLHQAALAGTVLTALRESETEELPPYYNYPLNLDLEYPVDDRPESLDEVVLLRHDLFWRDPDYRGLLRDNSRILKWLAVRKPELPAMQ